MHGRLGMTRKKRLKIGWGSRRIVLAVAEKIVNPLLAGN